MVKKKRTLFFVVGFTALAIAIVALTYMAFRSPFGPADLVVDVDLEPFSYPPEKRLPDLDALFRDATRGQTLDIDLDYSDSLLTVWAEVDVRQGSCTLYTSEGYFRFEPAGEMVAGTGPAGRETRYAFWDDSRFCIRLEGASAQVEWRGRNEDTSEGVDGLDRCTQSLEVRRQLRSRVVRLRFVLSEDFQGEVYNWDSSLPK